MHCFAVTSAWRYSFPLQTFECLKQLTIFGASEERSTQRCLAALQKAMPWLLLDV